MITTLTIHKKNAGEDLTFTVKVPREVASYILRLTMDWEEQFACTHKVHNEFIKELKEQEEKK